MLRRSWAKVAELGLWTPGLNVRSGAASLLSPPSCCPPDRGACCATLELGRGVATISTALLLALSGLQRGEARLQGAWKRDRGCLFSCLSWRRLPYWGLVFLELKHSSVPTPGNDLLKAGFLCGRLKGQATKWKAAGQPLGPSPVETQALDSYPLRARISCLPVVLCQARPLCAGGRQQHHQSGSFEEEHFRKQSRHGQH